METVRKAYLKALVEVAQMCHLDIEFDLPAPTDGNVTGTYVFVTEDSISESYYLPKVIDKKSARYWAMHAIMKHLPQ